MELFPRKREIAPCTVEVSHTFESLHASPVAAPYGEVVVEYRTATITRASWLERLWTRMTGDFEFLELCEFSFSEEVKL